MGTRAMRRPPRAHWAVLVLFGVVLLAELALSGYVAHVGAEGSGAHRTPDSPGAAPTAITKGSAVQRLGADGSISSRGMPPGTIALTFDDGPDPMWTPRILAILARYHARATFFEIGSRVNRYPQLSRR